MKPTFFFLSIIMSFDYRFSSFFAIGSICVLLFHVLKYHLYVKLDELLIAPFFVVPLFLGRYEFVVPFFLIAFAKRLSPNECLRVGQFETILYVIAALVLFWIGVNFSGVYIDKNIFGLVVAMFLIIVWSNFSGLILAIFSLVIDFRLGVYIGLFLFSFSFLNKIFVSFLPVLFTPSASVKTLKFSIFVFFALFIVVFQYYFFHIFSFDLEGRGLFSVLDASNRERFSAIDEWISSYLNVDFLQFMFGFPEIISGMKTAPHNDFIKILSNYGFVYLFIWIFSVGFVLVRFVSFGAMLSIVILSSFLGGIGWGGGLFLLASIYLYGGKQIDTLTPSVVIREQSARN